MPYSRARKIEHQLNKKTNDYLRTFEKESKEIWEKSINNTFEELYAEAYKMYDSLIDQFYSYKTKSYIRHGETRPGTQMGTNLYRGQQFMLTPGFIPQLTIDFSGEDMENYQHNSADEVLSMVMRGIRGVPSKGWWSTWKGSYNGKYFSVNGVDVVTAFNLFRNNFGYLSRYIFNEKINEEKLSGKYKFYK